MVARLMYFGDDEENPPIIRHVGDMNVPGSPDEYDKCIEARGPRDEEEQDDSANGDAEEEQDDNENDVEQEQDDN
ncbi:hypothetical protein M5689_019905 [Euphorbia peplus]|nr:hypothetical protein M5689_019905 [Euphorbia peplus]